MSEKRSSWSSRLSFVLATAASAIGIGNLWRFPYLAAQYGGGTFIVIYVALIATLGFSLIVTEVALGRYTRGSPLTSFSKIRKSWLWIGILTIIVPTIILPLYSTICGWVTYYFKTYLVMVLSGSSPMGKDAVYSKDFFDSFISSPIAPFIYTASFFIASSLVNMRGVNKGIEKANFILMPVLFFIAIALAIYVICLPGTGDGLRYYFVPSLDALKGANGEFSIAMLAKLLLGALGQMFFSLSLASAILISYGSYMSRKYRIETNVRCVEFFDTFISLLAGVIIIPVVFLFAQKTNTPVHEAMNAGQGLIFITLPKVFASFGSLEPFMGLAFFALVVFAGLTSVIALLEGIISSFIDAFNLSRISATIWSMVVPLSFIPFVSLSYGPFKGFKFFEMTFLELFDFSTGAILLPLVGLLTCIFVGWIMKPVKIIAECRRNHQAFRSWRFYYIVIRYIAPLLILALFVSELCRALGIGGWSI